MGRGGAVTVAGTGAVTEAVAVVGRGNLRSPMWFGPRRCQRWVNHFVDLEAFHRDLRAAANGPSGSDDRPRARRKHETTGSARTHPGRRRTPTFLPRVRSGTPES